MRFGEPSSKLNRRSSICAIPTEKNFRRIMGYNDLWMLKAALGRNEESLKEKAA